MYDKTYILILQGVRAQLLQDRVLVTMNIQASAQSERLK